jgi:hypothetical protein
VLGLAGLALLALGLVAGVALLLRDNQPTTPPLPDGSSRAVALDPVPTESITVTNSSVSTIARHDDQVLILDGNATTDGRDPWDPDADPTTRVWVVDADDPREAQPFDLPSVGPRLYPRVWWWDGQWAIVGERCPEPWDPAVVPAQYEDASEAFLPETCGSYTADVFRFDPASGAVQTVATGFEGTAPADRLETLEPRASSGDRALLVWSPARAFLLLGLDGSVTEVDAPANGAHILAAGDSFIALTHERKGDNQGPLVPAESHWRLQRFDGAGWTDEELPASGYERRWTSFGEVGDGYIATYGHQEVYSINEPRPELDDVLILHVDAPSGQVAWEVAPVAEDPEQMETLRVVDGHLVVTRHADDSAIRWDGSTWVPMIADGDPSAVYVKDFDAALSLEFLDNDEFWGELRVVIA